MVTAGVDRQQQQQVGGGDSTEKCMPGTEATCCTLGSDSSSKLEARTDWTNLEFGSNGFQFKASTEERSSCDSNVSYAALCYSLQNEDQSGYEDDCESYLE